MDLPKDINYQLMLRLEDRDLVNFCRINKKADEYCKDDTFWMNRIIYKFPFIPFDVLKRYKGDRSWAGYYIYDIRRFNKITRENLKTVPYKTSRRLDFLMIITNNNIKDSRFLIENIMEGCLDCVKYLFENGYEMSRDYLYNAIVYDRLDIVEYLVEKGLDIETPHLHLGTPLAFATDYNRYHIKNYLMKKGAKM